VLASNSAQFARRGIRLGSLLGSIATPITRRPPHWDETADLTLDAHRCDLEYVTTVAAPNPAAEAPVSSSRLACALE
jgi:hypothetical protein